MVSKRDGIFKMNRDLLNESWLSEYSTILRSSVWHLTSHSGILGIKKSGYIKPNLGSYEYTFPQSKNSYAKLKRYICLFDFCSASEEEFIYTFDRWSRFFWHHQPFTVVLKLNREYLLSQIVSNDVARKEVGSKKVWIPYVEAWYPKMIPLSAIERCFVVHSCREKSEFIEVNIDEFIE